MGVRGLWEVLGPVAKPVALESLANKRLAVDASIWIYQFLKAVRDSEGNVLKNAHIIGFFRRLCKLLYFDIKPVFVFDGEAPALKKQTISRRNERRAGKEYDARRTAAKLLSLQMQRLAEESKSRGKEKVRPTSAESLSDTIDPSSKEVVYFDDIGRDAGQRTKVDLEGPNQSKKKALDPYDLPKVDASIPLDINDTRLMTEEELAEYAEEFQSLATVGLYDTSKIDFDSPQFLQLPKATQYQLLNVARLRSRLRMGYSADQLDEMFPNRMEFSRFQVQRVAQRNFLTQKILGLIGFEQDLSQRVVGEKGSSYVLKKNSDNAEGGWTLALQKGDDVVELDADGNQVKKEDDVSIKDEDKLEEDDDIWEAVPIENESTVVDQPNLPDSLMNFENNIQRQNIYQKVQESEQSKNSEPEKSKRNPVTKSPSRQAYSYVPTTEEMLNRLLSKTQEGLAANPGKISTNSETFSQDLFSGQIPLFAGSSKPSKKHKSDASALEVNPEPVAETPPSENKEPEPVVPPWFSGIENQNPVEVVDTAIANNSDQDDDEELEEIVPLSEVEELLAARKQRHSITESDDNSEIIELSGSNVSNDRNSAEEISEIAVKNSESGAKSSSFKVSDEYNGTSPEVEHVHDVVGLSGASDAEEKTKEDEEDFEPVEIRPTNEGRETRNGTPEKEKIQSNNIEEEIIELDPVQKELAIEEESFDRDEDDRLLESMVQEIEESERFAQTLNHNKLADKSKRDYAAEINRLRNRQMKEQRDSDTVTQEMITECQELLTRFGIPYITAPYEAESQCAELMHLGLVDGIITDDSDCFLFGGKVVYKNMFNQSKFVESYELADVEHELGLDRRMLIQLAQLLGSDYTDGLPGVGPVTAVELLADFKNGDATLKDFTKWWGLVQQGRAPVDGDTEFRKKIRKRLSKKLFLPLNFPNAQVFDAYLHPQVDHDDTPFVWGVPDLDSLRTWLVSMTGWTLEKVNELLVPLIQDINKRLQKRTMLNQSSLGEFGFASLPARKKLELNSSNRMKRAMSSLIQDSEREKKRKSNKGKT